MMRGLIFSFCVIYSGLIQSQSIIQSGIASYYANRYEGKQTANGEKYRHSKLTAAHKSLPFNTKVKVTNLKNRKTVVVRINDRGPFVAGRIIDLSKSAAQMLDFINDGLVEVSIEVVDAIQAQKSSKDHGKPYMKDTDVAEKEFYDFNVTKISPKGFGVQIGTYKELINLVRLAENLKNSYQKKVTVMVSIVNLEKVYRIIIGAESSRKKVEKLRARLQRRYPDSFIVEFAKM